MTFSPHSVVSTDSTEHLSSRRGRREAYTGLTWFFYPTVKPSALRSPWQRQIHPRGLQSYKPKEIIEVAVAVAARVVVMVAVAEAAAATPPSAASLPSTTPTAAGRFYPSLPPSLHFRVMPGRK